MTKQNEIRMAGWALVAVLSGVSLLAARGENPEHVKRLTETRQCLSCDFQNARLWAIDVHEGNVSRSDFRGADLYRANFRGADLTEAQFGEANLNAADLRDTKGANLAGAVTSERTLCPNGAFGPCQ